MHLPFRRDHPEPEPFWRRLDRAAGQLNPFLLTVAVGLVLLYLTCVVGLLTRSPLNHIGACRAASPSPAAQMPPLTLPRPGF